MKEIVKVLEEYIIQYDCVFVFQDDSSEMKRICNSFCGSDALKNAGKKIMILATSEYTPVNGNFMRISSEEYGKIQEIYNLYECSDRLQIISGNSQYGNLLNYVKTGLLSEEQVYEALLY